MLLDPEVTFKIQQMTTQQMFATSKTIYKEVLRQLRHIFGGIYYTDGNKNMTRIQCVNGRQERMIGKNKKDNTLILPILSLKESGTANGDSRRRYNPILVHEKVWDEQEMRAKRVLSLPQRPIDLTYELSIWSKYTEDMDIIRSAIFSLFNPDLDVRTSFSDYTKAFIESELDLSQSELDDGVDRIIKKTITIKVETYMPMPKFLYTNTGQIEAYNTEIQVFKPTQDMETDDPEETIEGSDRF